MKPKRRIKIHVLGEPWQIHLYDHIEFNKSEKVKDNSVYGDCIASKRLIRVTNKELSVGTLVHELVHAYWFYVCIPSGELDEHQTEEAFASMFERFYEPIVKTAKTSYRRLR